MDGTVMDSLEDMWYSVNHTLARFSMPAVTLDQTRRYVGNGARRLIEQAVPAGTDTETVEKVLNYYVPYYAEHCMDNTKPYAGIPEIMSELKAAGIRQVIVSNKPDIATAEIAEVFFSGLTDFAVGEKEGIRRKPWPDMVYAALDRLQLSKEECVYVGDSEVDYATAVNSGLDCISVLWGFRSRELLESNGAKVFVETPWELRDLILNA